MSFLIRNLFLLFALVGTILAVVFLAGQGWSWHQAMEAGGRTALLSLLLISLPISTGLGHLFWGEAIVRGQGHEQNEASRLFQWELGVMQLLIAVVAMFFNGEQQIPLALLWAAFLFAAAVRHLIKKEPWVTALGDIWIGALVVGACLPALVGV